MATNDAADDGSRSSTGDDSQGSIFPMRVFDMVTAAGKSNSSAIQWISEGEAFVVHPRDAALAQLLSSFFNHSQYSSFQRQLNMYGWKKHTAGKYKGAFHHPCFHRDDSAKLAFIKRRPPPRRTRNKKRKKGDDESNKSDNSDGGADESSRQAGDESNAAEVATDASSKEDDEEEEDCKSLSSSSDGSFRRHDIETDGTSAEYAPVPPKYDVMQKVLARDHDGLMYEAVIRRQLFGRHHHKQIQVGMFSTQEEIDAELAKGDVSSWHYFVHYNKWRVNWDRWVAEDDIFELSEENMQFANLLLREHRSLQKEMKGDRKARPDGTLFLKRWSTRLQNLKKQRLKDQLLASEQQVDDENEQQAVENEPDENKDNMDQKPIKWSKLQIRKEKKLRECDLEGNRNEVHSKKIVIPFALKRIMVEAWELNSQCRMVPKLPAAVTVRHALDKYAESKILLIEQKQKTRESALATSKQSDPEAQPPSDENANAEADLERTQSMTADKSKREWQGIAESLAKFFDEALAFRLLYKLETVQHDLLLLNPDMRDRRKSEIYGCEHILRLCLRLPMILAEQLSEMEMRPILAKVNDFVRFLHKHEDTLFAQAYRKLNQAEREAVLKLAPSNPKTRKVRPPSKDARHPKRMRRNH